MEVVPDRSARSLCGFVEAAVEPGAVVVTDAWGGYATLPDRGYRHLPVAAQGHASVAEDFLPISHLIFSNLKSWLRGCHHGVSPQHLKPISTSSRSRFNRRFYPFNAFRSLLGISGQAVAPTYETGCTPVHGNIQNATAKAWRASSELGYRQNRSPNLVYLGVNRTSMVQTIRQKADDGFIGSCNSASAFDRRGVFAHLSLPSSSDAAGLSSQFASRTR